MLGMGRGQRGAVTQKQNEHRHRTRSLYKSFKGVAGTVSSAKWLDIGDLLRNVCTLCYLSLYTKFVRL